MTDNGGLAGAAETAKFLSITRAHLYALLASGRFGPVPIKLGRRTLFKTNEVRTWVEQGCPPRTIWAAKQKAEVA